MKEYEVGDKFKVRLVMKKGIERKANFTTLENIEKLGAVEVEVVDKFKKIYVVALLPNKYTKLNISRTSNLTDTKHFTIRITDNLKEIIRISKEKQAEKNG